MKPSVWLPALVLVVAASAFAWVYWTRPPPDQPRKPSVPATAIVAQPGYVGSAACQKCHADYAASYAKHGMAQTFGPVTPTTVLADFDHAPAVVQESTGFHFQAIRRGEELLVEESYPDEQGRKVHSLTKPVQYFLGSGRETRSFLYRHGERLYQLPLEWYGTTKIWDLPPGYEAGGDQRVFRQAFAGCLNCHTDYPSHRAWSEDEFVDPLPASMGCERCHGPGERHSKTSLTQDVVNPANLPPMRQIDICSQCHLEGKQLVLREGRAMYSFRPGEALHDWRTVFLTAQPEEDAFSFVSQGERMFYSACFQKSAGKMTCTTCHDPHHTSKDRPASYWNERCLHCHTSTSCTEQSSRRLARQDDCAACHMRKSEPYDVKHITITDHWIRKRTSPWKKTEKTRLQLGDPVTDLRPYTDLTGEKPAGPDAPALLGLAHWQARRPQLARPLLEQALVEEPKLTDARAALADLYLETRNLPAARAEYLELLRQRPGLPAALAGLKRLAIVAARGQLTDDASRLLESWFRTRPEDPRAAEELGQAWLQRGDAASERLFRRALTAAPDRYRAAFGLGEVLFAKDKWKDAAAHFDAARAIRPFDPDVYDSLRDCYRKLGDEERMKQIDHAAEVMARSPLAKAAAAAAKN